MSYRRGIWLYAGGSIAMGAVILGALTIYRRARGVRMESWERARSESVHGPREYELLPTLAREELSPELAEAIAASARSHGITQPIPEELAHDIAARAEDRRPIPGDLRHDVSSLIEPLALAPDGYAAGEELVDPGAIEVPLGQSAEERIDRLLSQSKLPQPDSTGASLQQQASRSGTHEIEATVSGRSIKDDSISARPAQEPTPDDESYDALAPDDLATEWLNRATEAAPIGSMGSELQEEASPPEILLEEGMAVVSEGSLNAASAEAVESAAIAGLEEADEETESIDDDAPSVFEEPALEKEARARRVHRRNT